MALRGIIPDVRYVNEQKFRVNLKILIGFIEGFINQAASHLVNKGILGEVIQSEGFHRQKKMGRTRKLAEEKIVSYSFIFLWGKGGRGLCRQMTSLQLKRKLQGHISGRGLRPQLSLDLLS